MNVLILNGSPHPQGNTAIAVKELVKTFEAEDVTAAVCQIGSQDIRGCIVCGSAVNSENVFSMIRSMNLRRNSRRLTV